MVAKIMWIGARGFALWGDGWPRVCDASPPQAPRDWQNRCAVGVSASRGAAGGVPPLLTWYFGGVRIWLQFPRAVGAYRDRVGGARRIRRAGHTFGSCAEDGGVRARQPPRSQGGPTRAVREPAPASTSSIASPSGSSIMKARVSPKGWRDSSTFTPARVRRSKSASKSATTNAT